MIGWELGCRQPDPPGPGQFRRVGTSYVTSRIVYWVWSKVYFKVMAVLVASIQHGLSLSQYSTSSMTWPFFKAASTVFYYSPPNFLFVVFSLSQRFSNRALRLSRQVYHRKRLRRSTYFSCHWVSKLGGIFGQCILNEWERASSILLGMDDVQGHGKEPTLLVSLRYKEQNRSYSGRGGIFEGAM